MSKWSLEKYKEHISLTCGDGWLKLIDDVYANLPDGIVITQVYQKWGALRFDIEPESEEVEEFLETIEGKSLSMCEVCGEPAGEKVIDGWVETLCDNESCLETCKKLGI